MDDGGPRMKSGMRQTGTAKTKRMTNAMATRAADRPMAMARGIESNTASCGTYMYRKGGKCNDARTPAAKPWKLF